MMDTDISTRRRVSPALRWRSPIANYDAFDVDADPDFQYVASQATTHLGYHPLKFWNGSSHRSRCDPVAADLVPSDSLLADLAAANGGNCASPFKRRVLADDLLLQVLENRRSWEQVGNG